MATPEKSRTPSGKVGRPPAGDRGERVKDYPQLSVRLPRDTRDKLAALSEASKQPQWRVIVDAVECYLRDLPKQEQTRISRMLSKP